MPGAGSFAHVSLVGISGFAGGHSCLSCGGRIEERALQIQWFKNLLLGQLGQRFSGQAFQQKSKHNEVQIAVNDLRVRLMFQRFTGNGAERRLWLAARRDVERSPGGKSRRMDEKLADGDR